MLSNIERRSEALEQREEIEHVNLDYDDGEIVAMAIASKVDEDLESFIEDLGLKIRSGPKWVGVGVEVVLG